MSDERYGWPARVPGLKEWIGPEAQLIRIPTEAGTQVQRALRVEPLKSDSGAEHLKLSAIGVASLTNIDEALRLSTLTWLADQLEERATRSDE